jgi:putative acyl-CoA dehydrogenase
MFEGDAVEEANARRLAGAIAVGLAAALLVRHAPRALADAYCASRLGEGGALGTLGTSADQAAIIARASQA